MVQVEGFVARQQPRQGLANGGVVQCRQPKALYRTAVAAMLDQLAGNHFAFAVGVGGNHQLPRFTEQALDRLELAGSLGLYQHLPLVWNDRQVGQVPALVAFVVAVGRGGFEQVADAPGHADVGALPAAIALAVGAEHFGDVFCLGGFFAEEQAHGRGRFIGGDGR
ncbi:hypothetical protein D3C75_732150 [compost metagenome]